MLLTLNNIRGSFQLLLAILGIPIFVYAARANNDTTGNGGVSLSGRESMLYIGKLDNDAKFDTIIARSVSHSSMLPTEIRWGKNGNNNKITKITYPNLDRVSGAVSFDDINLDSIGDVIVFIRGYSADSATLGAAYHKRFIIFGSNRLKNDSLLSFAVTDSALLASKCYIRRYIGNAGQQYANIGKHIGGSSVSLVKRGNFSCSGEGSSQEQQQGDIELPMLYDETDDGRYSAKVFPNPALEEFTVEIQTTLQSAAMKILDAFGREVIAQPCAGTTDKQRFTYSVSPFPTGLYIVVLSDERGAVLRSLPFTIIR